MDDEVNERFARIEQRMAGSEEIIDEYLRRTDEKLIVIGRQNAALSESVEMLGRHMSASTDALQQHLRDQDG